MIISLVNISRSPSVSGQALASALETSFSQLHVQVVDLVAAECLGPLPPAQAWSLVDQALGAILEQEPDLVALCLSVFNEALTLELCRRLRLLAPELAIALGGPEAGARQQELLRRQLARYILKPEVAESLAELLEDLGAARVFGANLSRRQLQRRYQERLDELIALGQRQGQSLTVEADLAGELPLWLANTLAQPAPRLSPAAALWRLRPLLQRGAAARLVAPELSTDGAALTRLLEQLPVASPRRLSLELESTQLTDALVERLCQAPVCQLQLDLSPLLGDTALADGLAQHVGKLAAAGIAVTGVLPVGRPPCGHQALLCALDASIQAGIEDLSFPRQLALPGSVLWQEAAVLHGDQAPYPVLAHAGADWSAMLASLRLAAVFQLLRPALAGSGLLRALAAQGGSAAEVLEGFADYLAAAGHDLLAGPAVAAPERLFNDYLRSQRALDLQSGRDSTRLERSPALSLRWLPDGRRLIADEHTGRAAHLGRHVLELLDHFDSPRRGYEACEELVSAAPLERRESLRAQCYRTLDKLISLSFLVPVQEVLHQELAGGEVPFTCLEEFDFHLRMLTDLQRVQAYQRAISAVVRPGQHAVEVGTGTGILAVLAAQAGAQVTAIERFSVVRIAQAVAAQNGVAERIRFIRGRSDLVQLEEPGDLLISELVGNRILNEGLLEATIDVRDRLLRPGAKLIPCALEIRAELGHSERFSRMSRALAAAEQQVGVTLRPLEQWIDEQLAAGRVVWELGADAESFVALSEELPVIHLDLERLQRPEFQQSITITPSLAGLANAVLLAFRLVLQPGIELSTSGAKHNLHWNKPVFMLPRPLAVSPQAPVRLTLSYESNSEIGVDLQPVDLQPVARDELSG